MHYRQLSKIGDSYLTEVGTSGHRTNPAAWKRIRTRLQTAILDLNNNTAKTPIVTLMGSTIADRKKFFLAAAEATKVDKSLEVKKAHAAAQARKEIAYCREWLRREGASADANGTINMAPMGALKVYYDDDIVKQGLTKIHIISGRVYTDSGATNPLNTKAMVTHFSGPGKAIYVMSAEGNIHVGSHVVGHYHHSSLLNGQPVACAGEIEVVDGYIKWLSNKSGHYFPNADHLVQVLHQLQKKGVALGFPLTVITASRDTKNFSNVGAFLADRQLNDEADYELMKLLAYSAHLTDPILATNHWRWRVGGELPGVYDQTTSLPIAHKVVRAWLKTNGLFAADEVQPGMNR